MALRALERFELDDPSFHPCTSRFDDYLDGKAELTPQELRGKASFDDPQRGNCAVCHLDRKGMDGSHPLFTDYQFEALGAPRNAEILRTGLRPTSMKEYVGPSEVSLSRRPGTAACSRRPRCVTWRPVPFHFHNGVFHSLKDALRFYVRRDPIPNYGTPPRRREWQTSSTTSRRRIGVTSTSPTGL